MNRFISCFSRGLQALFLLSLWSRVALADPVLEVEATLDQWVKKAMVCNPRVTAAWKLVEQAQAERDGVYGFLDPQMKAAAGRSEWARPVPGSSLGAGLDNNAVMGTLGVETAFRPGVYVAVGAAERHLNEPGSLYDSPYRTLYGGQVSIPLGRDRLFAEWRARNQRSVFGVESASNRFVAVAQEVRNDLERTTIEALRAYSDVQEATASLGRVRKLLDDAQELVRLKAVPEYQLFPTRMEVAFREEEKKAAEQYYETLCIGLAQRIGETTPVRIQNSGDALTAWAGAWSTNSEAFSIDDACRSRGLYRDIEQRIKAGEADVRLAREGVKPNVSIAFGATWQGNDSGEAVAGEPILTEDEFGTEAAVIWRQPWGFREARADVRAKRAFLAALQEELRQARLRIETELASARTAYVSARERLRLANVAVEEAGRTLTAEGDRFRLGEGRSRNVLDAEKDLSEAIRRRGSVAAAMLQAWVDVLYAAGYPGQSPPAPVPNETGGRLP